MLDNVFNLRGALRPECFRSVNLLEQVMIIFLLLAA